MISLLALSLVAQDTAMVDPTVLDLLKPTRTSARLIVSAEGDVEQCWVTGSSGHRELDEAVCAAFKKLAKFENVVTYETSGKGVELAEIRFDLGPVKLAEPNSWNARVIIRKRVEFDLSDELPRGGSIKFWEHI